MAGLTLDKINPWPCTPIQKDQEFARLAEALKDGAESVLSATTTAAWHKGGGTAPYVLTTLGRVDLPIHPARDWNIPNGWPVKLKRIPGGFRLLDDLLDDKIGTIKMWGAGAAPTGWAIMDGTANAAGTGIDMRTRFPKGGASGDVGDTGGSTDYTPEISGSGTIGGTVNTSTETDTFTTSTWPTAYAGTVSTTSGVATITGDGTSFTSDLVGQRIVIGGNTYTIASYTSATQIAISGTAAATVSGAAYTIQKNFPLSMDLSSLVSDDIIVPSHPDHYHEVIGLGDSPPAYDNTGGAELVTVTSPGYDSTAFTSQTYRDHDTVNATFEDTTAYGTTLYSELTNWSHAHTGTTDGHYHEVTIEADDVTFTGTPATIEPPFAVVQFIERMDNSSG